MREWPAIGYHHIHGYLIKSMADDGKEMQVSKSLEAGDAVHSGWVDAIQHCKVDTTMIFLRTKVSG